MFHLQNCHHSNPSAITHHVAQLKAGIESHVPFDKPVSTPESFGMHSFIYYSYGQGGTMLGCSELNLKGKSLSKKFRGGILQISEGVVTRQKFYCNSLHL